MICEDCKVCLNYWVSELGCYGSNEPCEHLHLDNQKKNILDIVKSFQRQKIVRDKYE